MAGTDAAVPESGSADTRMERTPRKSGKKNTEGDQSMLETSKTENSKEGIQTDLFKTPEASQGKMSRKRRKSGA